MNKNAKVYVAGHTGLIGSAILRELEALGYKAVTRTRKEMDLTDKSKAEEFFAKERPEYVYLAAARVGGIRANSTYPAEFIFENLTIQTNVIDLSYRYPVKKLLFLASSCIYPKMCSNPIREEYMLSGPIEPTNEPYAIAKLAGIKMCQSYNYQYGTDFLPVIPANVYGINDHFDEDGHVVASLIKKFHEAKLTGYENVTIWGTGKPKREFFYVDDLAKACIFLMTGSQSGEVMNIGRGVETSIAELAEIIKKIVGFTGDIIYDTTKPDGNPQRLLDSSKINRLGWKAETGLEKGLQVTYEWYKNSSYSNK
ncbi:MAG: GDP-L-fucose synthase [Candidatus Scalindua sp.]|nr:GDP-L-fucose synthase [Candidatus Scalindua sp.]